MIADRIEGKWIDLFADVFARCKLAPGDICAVLSESQSRALNVQLAELALARPGPQPCECELGELYVERARLRFGEHGANIAGSELATRENVREEVDPLAFD